jgi:hypothetical protein
MKPHQEMHNDGTPQGRDPRQMTQADLAECGLERISRGDAIRAKCLDCCGGSPAEVRRCGAVDCALWAFRTGTDPVRETREMSDEQRVAAGARLARARAARSA